MGRLRDCLCAKAVVRGRVFAVLQLAPADSARTTWLHAGSASEAAAKRVQLRTLDLWHARAGWGRLARLCGQPAVRGAVIPGLSRTTCLIWTIRVRRTSGCFALITLPCIATCCGGWRSQPLKMSL